MICLSFVICHWDFVVSAHVAAEPPRAMWVWDVKIPASKEATQRLIEFCKSKNINLLYMSAYNFSEPNIQHYRTFNAQAHNHGISVYALGGDPRWGLEKYHQQPLRWVGDILSFNRAVRSGERFDGIENDTEVYLLGKIWEQNKDKVFREYLDLNKKIIDLRQIEEADIIYSCDIPFWYDDDPSMSVNWDGRTKPPSFHLLDIIDTATVMDYRNFADSANGSIALAKNEITYAASVAKKVYVGQETQENVYPEYITFSGMSEREMEVQIKKLVEAYAASSGFAGIAMHHYVSYRKLVERK